MCPQSSPREKVWTIGALMFLAGLGGVVFIDTLKSTWGITLPGTLRIVAATCLIVGWPVSILGFFLVRFGRNRLIGSLRGNSRVLFYARIVALLLWIVILPLAILSVYDYIHRLRR